MEQEEGLTALYSRLLLSCRVGLRVGGGGLSRGAGVLCNSVKHMPGDARNTQMIFFFLKKGKGQRIV